MIDYKKRIKQELRKQRRYFKEVLDGKISKPEVKKDIDLGQLLLDRINLLEGLLEDKEDKMQFDLTKEEVEYILQNIRVDVDNYIENKRECVPKKVRLQDEKIIPEVVWKKAIIGSDCHGDKELLEKLFKKLIEGGSNSSQD